MRCVCGYPREYHGADGRCPLCACGKAPDEHGPYTDPPAVLYDAQLGVKTHWRCPSGETQLRAGSFREPAPTATRSWFGLRVPVIEPETAGAHKDRVPRRRAEGAGEVAPAAVTLGRKALAAGWVADAYYRELHDGAAWSILAFARDTGERAIGVWRRPAGGRWLFRAAAGPGRVPMGANQLKKLISD